MYTPEGNSIPSPSLVRLQREARRISRLSHFNLMQCQWLNDCHQPFIPERSAKKHTMR